MKESASLAAAVLSQIAKVLDKLSVEQLEAIAKGDAQIAFISSETVVKASGRKSTGTAPRKSTAAARASVDEVALRLPESSDREEAARYLEQSNLRISDLRALGKQLGISLPSKGTKDQLTHRLIEGAVGYRLTHGAILGEKFR